MPSWVTLPPNLVHDNSTKGKTIYQTDYNSKRPTFQIHMQKARTSSGRSSHHPHPPKSKDRRSVRMSQTGDYMALQEAFETDFGRKDNKTDVRLRTTMLSPPAGSEAEHAILNKYINPSLQMVEKSWKDEAHATKRDRGRMYQSELARTKMGLQTRPGKKEVKSTSGLPGLNNWLKSSNEYEKAVVFNFMDTVSKATKPPTPRRPVTPKRPSTAPKTFKPDFSNEYYHRQIQRPKSVRSQRVTEKPHLPPRPSSVAEVRQEVDRSTANPAKEKGHPTVQTETHHYYPPPHIHHSEAKCETCDYYRVKKLLELIKDYDVSKLGDSSLSHLLRPRVDPSVRYPDEDYDYVHDNSFFSLTTARDRGYFIVAPDWVSEKKGILYPRYK